MAQIIKRPFRTFNGTDWDEHYFRTSEDMIVSSNQLMRSAASYKIFPVDNEGRRMIVQTGTIKVDVGGTKVVFPIAFPTSLVSVVTSVMLPATCRVAYYDTSLSGMSLTHDYGSTLWMSWIAIGF